MRDVRADYALQGLCEAWSWLRLLLHKQISSSSTTVASLHSRYMLYIDYIFERLYNGQWYLLARFFLCTLALCMTMNEKRDIKLKFWQKLVSRKKAGSKVTKRSGRQKEQIIAVKCKSVNDLMRRNPSVHPRRVKLQMKSLLSAQKLSTATFIALNYRRVGRKVNPLLMEREWWKVSATGKSSAQWGTRGGEGIRNDRDEMS